MNAKALQSRIIGYEILRRVTGAEVSGYPIDPTLGRGVLGTPTERYLVPPSVDLFELGLLDREGQYELLPITTNEEPLWDGVIHVLVTEAQADRQREILLRSYRTLHRMIREADELEASAAERPQAAEDEVGARLPRRGPHPVFGMLRLAMIDVWKMRRRGRGPLCEKELD